jgi:hypothetical protein
MNLAYSDSNHGLYLSNKLFCVTVLKEENEGPTGKPKEEK